MSGNLENLYYNKIDSQSRRYNKNENAIRIMKKVNSLEAQLLQTLDENQVVLLHSLVESITDLTSVTVSDAYANGFRQGTKFIKDTLDIELPE